MSQHRRNDILSGSVIGTFFKHIGPSMMGLVALTCANVVDGIFIGKFVGSDGLAAISMLLPYITFLVAVSLMLAVGGAVRIGIFMGKKDTVSASGIFTMVLTTAFIVNLFMAIGSYFFQSALLSVLHIPVAIIPLVEEYLGILRWAFIVQFFTMVLYYLVRADGAITLATTALVFGAMINIVLTAIFVGHFDMGIEGAAYATALSQVCQLCALCVFFKNNETALNLKLRLIPWRQLPLVLKNGFSEFVNEVSVGVLFLVLNVLLVLSVGSDGVAAFSIVNYFIFVSVMLSFGVADALHLLVSYNVGANQLKRTQQFLWVSLLTSSGFGLCFALSFMFFDESLLSLFVSNELGTTSTVVLKLAHHMMFLVWPLFIVNGCNILMSVFLTANEKPKESTVVALCRSLLLPVVFLYVFYYANKYFLNVFTDSISFIVALPIAEWVTVFIASLLVIQTLRTRQNTV